MPGPYGQATDRSRDYEREQEFTRWVMARRADSACEVAALLARS